MNRHELRHQIEQAIIKEIPYHETLGDTSNPDYVGPQALARMVDEIMNIFAEQMHELSDQAKYAARTIRELQNWIDRNA